jgi:multisubunit Na+/H+ antiporter MnhE subunit
MTLLLVSLPLLLAFVALTGPEDPWNWALGFGIALLLVVPATRARGGRLPAIGLRRLISLPLLLWGILRGIAAGSWMMLMVVTGRRNWRNVGFITVEQATRTEAGLALLALAQSATPGSVVAETDAETRSLVINLLDCTDPEAARAEVVRFYRRFQRPSVP